MEDSVADDHGHVLDRRGCPLRGICRAQRHRVDSNVYRSCDRDFPPHAPANGSRGTPAFGPDVANERLTSTGGLEFDYIPDAKCSRVRFHFTLYDDQNILRGATDDA